MDEQWGEQGMHWASDSAEEKCCTTTTTTTNTATATSAALAAAAVVFVPGDVRWAKAECAS